MRRRIVIFSCLVCTYDGRRVWTSVRDERDSLHDRPSAFQLPVSAGRRSSAGNKVSMEIRESKEDSSEELNTAASIAAVRSEAHSHPITGAISRRQLLAVAATLALPITSIAEASLFDDIAPDPRFPKTKLSEEAIRNREEAEDLEMMKFNAVAPAPPPAVEVPAAPSEDAQLAPVAPTRKGISDLEISKKLRRVPIFSVTNSRSLPYLTEQDDQGTRFGLFYLNQIDAITRLARLKSFDNSATVSVLNLEQIYFDISKSIEDVRKAPKPTGGTSADPRVFQILPIEEEFNEALNIDRGRKTNIMGPSSVPLFFEPSLQLRIEGKLQRPYFFRFGDLQRAFEAREQSAEADGVKLNNPPRARIITLDGFVRGLQEGDLEKDSMIVAASEAIQAISNIKKIGSLDDANNIEYAVSRENFFLETPFAQGRAPIEQGYSKWLMFLSEASGGR